MLIRYVHVLLKNVDIMYTFFDKICVCNWDNSAMLIRYMCILLKNIGIYTHLLLYINEEQDGNMVVSKRKKMVIWYEKVYCTLVLNIIC